MQMINETIKLKDSYTLLKVFTHHNISDQNDIRPLA